MGILPADGQGGQAERGTKDDPGDVSIGFAVGHIVVRTAFDQQPLLARRNVDVSLPWFAVSAGIVLGKLPFHGDFVARGVSAAVRDEIDRWLVETMATARDELGPPVRGGVRFRFAMALRLA